MGAGTKNHKGTIWEIDLRLFYEVARLFWVFDFLILSLKSTIFKTEGRVVLNLLKGPLCHPFLPVYLLSGHLPPLNSVLILPVLPLLSPFFPPN